MPGAAWLDAALIQEALRRGGEERARVEAVEVVVALAPGENYVSTVYRVRATLADGGGERSFVVKGPAAADGINTLILDMRLFAQEAELLARIVPRMEALLEAASPRRFRPLAPRCPHYGTSPVDFLVLEDLKPLGFVMADRQRGLDLEHCLLAIRTLAVFHAASAALLKREPNVDHALSNPFEAMSFKPYVTNFTKQLAEACRRWSGFEEYADALDAFTPIAFDTFIKLLKPRPGKFNCLVHGDYWTNNMMFRYEDGHPAEVRMLDFQMGIVSSPITDLLFFLCTSPSEDVYPVHDDLMMREYHAVLGETMQLLGLEGPSKKDFLADMKDLGLFILFGFAVTAPFVRASRFNDMNDTISENSSAAGIEMYEDPPVKRWFQHVLPEYKRKGWLDPIMKK